MTPYLMQCTTTIMHEVESRVSRKSIALSYALAIRSKAAEVDTPDWPTINRAILKRWPRGLRAIKKRAWAIVEGRVEPSDG